MKQWLRGATPSCPVLLLAAVWLASDREPMRRVRQAALIVAGLIHFLPVTGVIGAERLTSMYAMPFADPSLLILMRHRAVMLGLLGGFVLYGAFRPAMLVPAIVLGTTSLASIVALAWSTGGYNQALSRVILADSIAVLFFLASAALYAAGRRKK